jgi:hypothetical protein
VCGGRFSYNAILSLRGKSGARDVVIHRILRKANGFVYSLTGSQWIATGFALAMTGLERNGSVRFGYIKIFVIARKERSEGRGNPLYAMDTYRPYGSLPSSQWIARGFRPCDDKVKGKIKRCSFFKSMITGRHFR